MQNIWPGLVFLRPMDRRPGTRSASFFTLLYWGDKNHPMLFSRDPNTIFRGNSLTSKCIDETMKLAGMHYLHVTLKPTIEEVGQGPEAPALLGGGRGVSPGAHMPA